jgi:uncharacterized membrane protein YraQ (UPF0718 family)
MVNNTLIFAAVTGIVLLVSLILDRKKTLMGLKKGMKMFFNIVPPFLNILILVSILLFIVPQKAIIQYLGPASGGMGFLLAAIVGSITLIPGFISYPIAAALIGQGAAYSVVAVFMTTLMMVGVVTLPLEIKYLGKKAAILRNILNFIAAIIIGLCVGWLMRL